jgi:hypothetical protein
MSPSPSKVDTVLFVAEYLPALYASNDDMVEGPRGVYPRFSRHGRSLPGWLAKVKHKIMNVPFSVPSSIHDARTPEILYFLKFLDNARSSPKAWQKPSVWEPRFAI